MISIVLPVYNEEQVLEKNIRKLIEFLDWDNYKVIIADNASTDKTSEIGRNLSLEFSNIIYYRLEEKGKGIAVVSSWQKYPADFNVFMDIDFSTDLSALPKLIDNNYDIIIGSRRRCDSVVERSFLRRLVSTNLNLLLQTVFKTRIKDTACGFKAINKKVLDEILPKIENKTWFFDTEMLILAEKGDYKIKEVSVKWTETPEKNRKSSVGLFSTIFDYFKEIWRLHRGFK
ncbi:MAG: glycosyltransferase [Patescibacteria group bacterium]|nr:glycosyltransferase [Patescibacteria group bacterium]